MSECSILPVAAVLPIAVPAASATPIETGIEGEPASDIAFTVDEAPSEELAADPVAPDAQPADMPPQDRLQMLIEDLSGVTSTLRESPPAEAEPTAQARKVPDTPGRDVRILAGTSPDFFSAAEGVVQPDAGAGPVEAFPVDVPVVDALLADSPLPATVRGKEIAPAPLHPSSPKIPVAAISQQIAEAVVTAREDRIEVVLAPEELGRIRMVMSGPEHNPHVLIWAERPEVLDQLRRNASFLQECFGDAGMAGASFEFQGDGSDGSGGRQSLPDGIQQGFDMAESISVPLAWAPLVVPARLDIRI